MFRWFDKLLDRVCAVFGALAFLQFPGFALQYAQQLAGHVAELSFQIDLIYKSAAMAEKPLPALVEKFLASGDVDVVYQGVFIQALLTRYAELNDALTALQAASPLLRPLYFLTYFNWSIVQETWKGFTFGIPLTVEGGLYALFGLIVGFSAYALFRRLLSLIAAPFLAPWRKSKCSMITNNKN